MISGPKGTVKLARKLRSEMTLPEGLLWRELRKRPGGFKFRRQHPAGAFVIDFYCAAVKLAIEVDGVAHDAPEVMQRDAAKSHFLRSQGVATLRIPAKVVLEDMALVLTRIVAVCEERGVKLGARLRVPLHHPADGPPPPRGAE
ncbi:MAG: endonuclease domain-containing protein [Novosphingobium sp.]|nr:endonuclease domain-containing protein [Novosphingobium sp.]MDP3551498.1 endonuclease domain-containing protein [Novosphingobium sp.]